MRIPCLITLSAFTLGACAEVVSESSSTIVVDGRSYELRTSVVQGSEGTYERSAVVVKNGLYTCLPASPGDCKAAVRRAHNERSRR